ncbi:LysR substrate-binding domain-containing protein [Shewanella waksmanii]|uniref:LysR substrate-binding domain-containing protein n=1 Tax=Shewanella waksmanii TaxID=213783 RepID=UPI0037354B5A
MQHSPITLEALLVLDAIDNRGSFAAAAEQLNKVPSAVSYIVQKLEEQLSVTLFVRQGRRSILTPAGRYLLDEGRKVLGVVGNIAQQTQTISHGWEPKIRVTFDTIFDVTLLLPVLAEFLIHHPNIEIDLTEEVMNGGWEALIEDRIDLLIGAPAPVPSQQGIRATPVYQILQKLIVAHSHPLAHQNQPITKADIAQYRTVVVHDSAKKGVPWSTNVIEQSQRFYVDSVDHKIAAITAGIGVGFLPVGRVQHQLARGELVAIEVTDAHNQTDDIYMAWKMVNKGKGLQHLRTLIDQLVF